ncbi:type VI secretion system baseplate subunit TssG [Rhodanobacter glycinis]|uniref:Type VI secretion system baseplate subunit TssG n=1 Tax=Rhodanobacter glycinis TaxID=582702 RepID=A0A5B9DVQ0_9GAMM|nr:type VI secretion system baseplate subunit TssG [Rhodanobacter glycinis]QEE23298.1 type VI secretion system baseplate subunit TssG [Rhodanobacter glycinis]
MSGAKRRIDPGVAQRLLDAPHRFQFFQAVRVLEHLFVRNGARPQDVVTRKLRFRNTLSMGFPASEIEQLRAYAADDAPLPMSEDGQSPAWNALAEVDLTPAFMGMLGGRGVLPYGYTEQLGERETYHRDHAARAFLDIFNNRAMALFYGAWKKYRLAFQYELDKRERFLPLVMSLAGMGSPALRSRLAEGEGAVFDQAIAYYSAGIGQRPLSAAFLQRMLREYFDVDIRLEQFVGAWYAVPPEQRSRLGEGNAVLGRNALSGERVWQRDLRMRLWVGPLRRTRFEEFLPGGKASAALAKWLTLLGGDSLEYEVRLVLHKDDVRSTGLTPLNGGRLGWDAIVNTQPANDHRADASYLVHTLN